MLLPWTRPNQPLALTRRCPDCPAPRRQALSTLRTEAEVRALGAAISAGADAESTPTTFALRVGELRCAEECCTWSVGLLDHGATHLEEACFGQDASGPILIALSLVDA